MKTILLIFLLITLFVLTIGRLVAFGKKYYRYKYITPFKRRCKKCDQEQWLTDDDYWIAMYGDENPDCKCHNDIVNFEW